MKKLKAIRRSKKVFPNSEISRFNNNYSAVFDIVVETLSFLLLYLTKLVETYSGFNGRQTFSYHIFVRTHRCE